jgi:restriction system protein
MRASCAGHGIVFRVHEVPTTSGAFRKGRMIQALFEELKAAPDGLAAKDATAGVREKVTLTPEEEGAFAQSGAEKFPKILRFATITVTKAGWMQKQDGVWTVTEVGVKALDQYPEPEAFWKHARMRYAQWKKDATVDVDDDEASEEEVAEATSLEDAEDEARAEILGYLAKMPPLDFQTACAKVVGALGHRLAWISPPGPDGGLDFVAYADPIGATGRRIKGQAKRHQSKQDVDDVGAFLSKLKGDDVGVLIALGGFTKNAEAMGRSDERRLVLLDGSAFVRLWIEHYAALDEEARSLLRLKPIWRLVRPVD